MQSSDDWIYLLKGFLFKKIYRKHFIKCKYLSSNKTFSKFLLISEYVFITYLKKKLEPKKRKEKV